MKKFNLTAICIPSRHYMVDISDRVAEIKKMIDAGEYFCDGWKAECPSGPGPLYQSLP